MRRSLAVLIALVCLSGASPAAAGEPHWVVGVAYGPAKANIQGSDSLSTGWVEGPAQSIRVGRIVNPALRVGFEHQAWLREQGFHDLKIRASVQLEALGATYYPKHMGGAWSGLYVGGGVGWAHCRLTFLEPLAPGESPIGDTYEEVFEQDEFGWGWYGGLGYEFRITRHFAAGAMLSYNRVDIGGSIYDTAEFVPLIANLNWSF